MVEVSMLIPQGTHDIPLVIYLPGLGESADSDLAWQRAWAEAGYAVVSVQPEKLGKVLLPSPSDHSGDFSTIAREQYAPIALSHRLTLVASALDELKRRSRDPQETALALVDFNRIAVAGFDLGAQTAMAVAGEMFDSALPFKGLEGVKCVIALSPYAGFSGPAFEQRFGAIHLPVLSVTSMDDADPYGVVSTPEIRRAPFQYMPPDRKYLLALYNVPHSLIGGSETPPASSRHDSTPATTSENNGGNNGNTRGRHHGRGGNYGGGSSRSESSGARQISPTAWSDQLKLIQSVSTAYLDATVKADPEASRWLVQDAHRWLGESADLTSK
jgi:dienelactone hydrolase